MLLLYTGMTGVIIMGVLQSQRYAYQKGFEFCCLKHLMMVENEDGKYTLRSKLVIDPG
jgi:hypothetical protein